MTTKPSCPIFHYHTTHEAIQIASEYAKDIDSPTCVYRAMSKDRCPSWKVGNVVVIKGNPARTLLKRDEVIFRTDEGAEIFKFNVSYIVYPCGSVYDRRMKIGIGPKFCS